MKSKDRLRDYFIRGVGEGFAIVMFHRKTLRDPLAPMPTVREWLDSYGGVHMDAATFDRCEADWYALLDRRKRVRNVFLNGAVVGAFLCLIVEVVLCLGVLVLILWLVLRLTS